MSRWCTAHRIFAPLVWPTQNKDDALGSFVPVYWYAYVVFSSFVLSCPEQHTMIPPQDGTFLASERAFEGKVVVITGGASGIGKALAIEFFNCGAKVALLDLQECSGFLPGEERSGSSQHRRRRYQYLTLPCDVTHPKQVEDAISFIKKSWGKIDIYCSNAGIMFTPNPQERSNEVTRYSNTQWEKIFRVNVLSHLIASRILIPDWEVGKGDGIFVMTASAAGLLTQIGDASYGVSKAAAVSFAEHMAITHPTIQVHCLCPQAVDTPLVDPATMGQNSAMRDGMVSAEYVAKNTLQAIKQRDFWIFPHPQVSEYVKRKATDHARWLKGMQRLRQHLNNGNSREQIPSSKI